jgi:uncharacterized membrane protein
MLAEGRGGFAWHGSGAGDGAVAGNHPGAGHGRATTGLDRQRDARGYRLQSIDMLRGLVIVIMALDHVRDLYHAGGVVDPTAAVGIDVPLFFTRWITHFCAPVFVFLAGTSAGLMAGRKAPGELARFLFTRALWLLFVEVFVMATALTFSPFGIAQFGGMTWVLMQVLWAIGVSMAVLAGLQFLGRGMTLIVGAAIVIGHNLLDPIWPVTQFPTETGPLWHALHAPVRVDAGPFQIWFLYPVLPWIGVMALGFGSSALFELAPEARRRRLIGIGLAATVAFVLLRAVNGYGEPTSWSAQAEGPLHTLASFLDTTKYPPSLQFLTMTLGPAALLLAYAEGLRGRIVEWLVTFGRVPFMFYIAHIWVIHLGTLLVAAWQGFAPAQVMTLFLFFPEGYGLALPGVYVVWVLVVLLLYPLCRWFAALKRRRKDWWLSYL